MGGLTNVAPFWTISAVELAFELEVAEASQNKENTDDSRKFVLLKSEKYKTLKNKVI